MGEPAKTADLRWHPLDGLPANLVAYEERVLRGLGTPNRVPALVTFGF